MKRIFQTLQLLSGNPAEDVLFARHASVLQLVGDHFDADYKIISSELKQVDMGEWRSQIYVRKGALIGTCIDLIWAKTKHDSLEVTVSKSTSLAYKAFFLGLMPCIGIGAFIGYGGLFGADIEETNQGAVSGMAFGAVPGLILGLILHNIFSRTKKTENQELEETVFDLLVHRFDGEIA